MEHHWYAGESSYTIPASSHGEGAAASFETASPWMLFSQIREAVGQGRQLDPSFFEESWASGVPVGLDTARQKKEQVVPPIPEGWTFAELSSCGGSFVTQADAWQEVSRPCPCSSHATDVYAADWLRDTKPDISAQPQDHHWKSENQRKKGDVPGATDSMKYRRACQLLCVNADSTEETIRAAYRRKVGEWHPDRHEQSGETIRAFATRQMAAINEAYHFLRGSLRAATRQPLGAG